MLANFVTPVSVVAHDAGAANHLIAWLKTGHNTQVKPWMDGPASALWQAAFGVMPESTLFDTVAASTVLLSGTGWASDTEHQARQIAKKLGIHSIAVVDHWTNYKERFIRQGEEILPDEIWVSDRYAKDIAERIFPATPVTQQANLYLENLVLQVKNIKLPVQDEPSARVLYLLEPIRQAWGASVVDGEFAALDFFIENVQNLNLGKDVQIRLRPHPSDANDKYVAWIARHAHLGVTLDSASTLVQALAWSSIVVGCQTYAMVVALSAGRRVISTIPPWAPPCILPYPEIIPLSSLILPTFSNQKMTVTHNQKDTL